MFKKANSWIDRRERLASLKNLPPVLKMLWCAAPRAVAAGAVFRVIIALLPLTALWIAKLIVDIVSHAKDASTTQIWLLLAAEFGVAALGAILGRAVDYCDARIADEFARDVTLRVMQHASTLDLQSFEDPVFYDKLERARVQAQDRVGMLNAVGRLLQQSVTLVSFAAAVMAFSPMLFGLLVLSVVPAFIGETHFAFLSYSLAYSLTPLRRELDYLRDLGSKKESAKELKIFGLGDFFRDRYANTYGEVIGRNRRLGARKLRWGALLAILGSLGYYAAYASVVFRGIRGQITIGELWLLVGALAGASTQIQMVFSTFTSIADQTLFLTDLIHFFAVKPKIVTRAQALPAPRPIREGFEFQNVSFSYPGSDRLVLNNLTLRIGAGERIAIVGENGQGKTTLVKLMTRLYDPTSGRILLDGIDLRDYDLNDLHREIGVIFQDFMRYDMTARENIAVGNISAASEERTGRRGLSVSAQDRSRGGPLSAAPYEDRLRLAARKSGAIEVINRFPDELDQMLGRRFEDGVDLSGGEWQKFAMARAYVREAQILILDEPTAALDAIAEYGVFQHFAELTSGKISVLISHRFSTVRMSDRIVVLEGGAIREEGTHQELVTSGGRYASMFELQAASYR